MTFRDRGGSPSRPALRGATDRERPPHHDADHDDDARGGHQDAAPFAGPEITEDELLRCEAGEPDALEADLHALSPLGITDIDRSTPAPDPDDLIWMDALQRAFGERCRDIVPDGVTGFSLSAAVDEGKLDCAVESPVPFALNAQAEAALRRIFLALAARGEAVEGLRVEMVGKPDGSWSTVIELDHQDIAAVEPAS